MSGRIDQLVKLELELEREACAVVCDERAGEFRRLAAEKASAYYSERADEARCCAAAIRQRGSEGE